MITPEIYILDNQLTLLGVMDLCTSLRISRSFWEIGTLEAHTSLGDPGRKYLVPGNLLWLDSKRCFVIDYVELTDDKESPLIIMGRQIKGILEDRLVVPDAVDDQNHFGWDRFPAPNEPDVEAETIFKYYAKKHASNSAPDPKRRFPNLVIAPDEHRGMKTRWSDRFVPLSGMLDDLGVFTGMGWDVIADRKTSQLIFDVIPERDQTATSDAPVIFSPDFENVGSIKYELDTAKEATVGYLGGKGTDEERLIYALMKPETESGWKRKETFISCGSIANIDDLIFEGEYRMKKKTRTETLEADPVPTGSFEYMKDWDLGSIVTLRSKKLGRDINQKITEVEESWEASGYQCKPTFGMRSTTFLDEIRKQEAIE